MNFSGEVGRINCSFREFLQMMRNKNRKFKNKTGQDWYRKLILVSQGTRHSKLMQMSPNSVNGMYLLV